MKKLFLFMAVILITACQQTVEPRVSDEDIMEINVPNGIPLVYELDDNLKPIQHFYLD